jgi:D-alanyl-D-alanine carboxypeptidase/D-alanyl-D-alanine-endopeptidase (penicillin-binding protein 4)
VRARALSLLVLGLAGLAGVRPAAGAPKGLKSGIDAIVEAPRFAHAWWGVEVRSLRSGKVLYARNAERDLKPASTLKLVTTAAALDALGPAATLKTTVEAAGRLDAQGRLLGDAYLVGGGDPNLSGRFTEGRVTAAFESLADQLRAGGVKRIEGRLVGQEGLFQGDRRGDDWSWGDLVWRYGAEVSALSFNDNVADLTVAPGERAGEPAVVDRQPVTSYYRVASTATTGPRGTASTLTLRRALGSNVVQLSGALPLGQGPQSLGVALEDPARYAATVFAEVLTTKGIVVTGDVATSSDALPAGRRTLATWESRPISEIVGVVNKVSQNLHTEMLLRLLGARVKGQGTVEAGHEAEAAFLKRLGARSESWSLQDASGLSRSDLVTPHGMVDLLAGMDRHRHAEAFRASLPVAGVDGTLADRMKGTPAEGKVRAKTGSIRNVNALGGYVDARSGDRMVFYAVVNHHLSATDAVEAIDAIATLLARQ